MDYDQPFARALAHARAALAVMEEREIAPHPKNFAIWYTYFAGAVVELTQTLDSMMEDQQAFDTAHADEVYERFFSEGDDHASVRKAAELAAAELTTVLSTLEQAEVGAAEYGKALESASGQIAGASGSADLKKIVGKVLRATNAMNAHTQGLESRLKDSASQISTLRQDLDDMRRQAYTDALTGIANRKQFDTVLRQSAAEAAEKGEDLSLLLLDIDHFKKFNDTWGHQVGDQVLKLLAHTMGESVKGQDTPARYGGEEFAVILPRTSLANAVHVAENIRQRVAGKKVVNRKTQQDMGQITVSVGAAQFVFGEPLARVIARADEAMYAAKRAGRNRVVSEKDINQEELALGA